MARSKELPDLGEALRPLVESLPDPVRPRFLALLERNAGERYRTWARLWPDAAQARGLRECGEREDRIAALVDELFPRDPGEEARFAPLLPKLGEEARFAPLLPKLADVARELFQGRPLLEQFAIQAAGERTGASVWRLFASQTDVAAARETLLRCAALEEASAELLESLGGSSSASR
jgi:hypothetical protein